MHKILAISDSLITSKLIKHSKIYQYPKLLQFAFIFALFDTLRENCDVSFSQNVWKMLGIIPILIDFLENIKIPVLVPLFKVPV